MNGRIYDPDLGRFLQPDPVIQAPNNAQSWNAYSYVFNNPLRYTDPTGMIGIAERQWAATAFAIVYTYFTWDLQGGAAIAAAAAGGFVSGSIATGSWDGGIRGAFTAGLAAGQGARRLSITPHCSRCMVGRVFALIAGSMATLIRN